MKPSTLFSTVLAAASIVRAGVIAAPAELDSRAIDRRDGFHAGELIVYRTQDRFLCVGTVVLFLADPIVSASAALVYTASSQFATWVTSKITRSTSAVEGMRDGGSVRVWDEDEDSITYAWGPAAGVASRDDGGLVIHNMTKRYSKTRGSLMQADMTFDGVFEVSDGLVSKRSSSPIFITYWATKGHQETKLSKDNVESLYTNAFPRTHQCWL